MPTYAYKCTSCQVRSEAVQSMMDAPLQVCSECGGKLIRLISGGLGISFKGEGFYVNDSVSSVKEGDTTSVSSDQTKSSSDQSSNEETISS